MAPPPSLDALLADRDFVHRLACKIVASREADDLAQEATLAALRRPPRGSHRPWLAATIRRMARLESRSRAARSQRERVAARPEAVASAAEIVAREEQRQRLVRAVVGLPPAEREAILLRYFEGLPPRAIANHLAVPVATVKTRLKRGLARLRHRFRDDRPHGLRSLAPLFVAGQWNHLARGLVMATNTKVLLGGVVLAVLATLIGIGLQLGRVSEADVGGLGAALPEADEPRSPQNVGSAATAGPGTDQRRPPEGAALPDACSGTVVVRGEDKVVPGVTVTFLHLDGRKLETTTDALGSFAFGPAGDTRFVGLTVSAGPATAAGKLDAPPDGGFPDPLVVEVGRGATLTGRVLDEGGQTVPGAEVRTWCSADGDFDLDREPDRRVVTDREGRFSVPHAGRDVYLAARSTGLFSLRHIEGRVPSGVEQADGFVLRVGRVRGLYGRVLARGGGPVNGATVRVLGPSATLTPVLTLEGRGSEGFEARTVSDGGFRLDHTAGPDGTVTVSREGYQTWQGAVPDEDTPLEVVLEPSLELRGVVLDQEGFPVAGARVELRGRVWIARATTAGDGTFVLSDLDQPAPSERRALGVVASGYAVEVVDPVLLAPDAPPVEVRLSPGHALQGQVRWVDDRPAGDVKVSVEGDRVLHRDLHGSALVVPTWEREFLPFAVRTDAEGRFRFEDLYSGEFEVTVSHGPDSVRHQRWTLRSGGPPADLVLDPGVVQEVLFEGVVVDAVTRAPVPRFTARAIGVRRGRDYNGPVAEFSSGDGRFALPGEPPGQLRVFVEADGYVRGTSEYREWPTGTHTVSVELTPVLVRRARVVDRDGEPIAEAVVRVTREDGTGWWLRSSPRGRSSSVRTDDLGEVVLHELPVERVTFSVHPRDGEPEDFQVCLDLRNQPEGILELRPSDDD